MTEPIFLQGICKDYLWGGNRLREEFGKKAMLTRSLKAGNSPATRTAAACSLPAVMQG